MANSHSGSASGVDNHTLATAIHVMIQTKERRHSMYQHPMIRGHLWKFQIWLPEGGD